MPAARLMLPPAASRELLSTATRSRPHQFVPLPGPRPRTGFNTEEASQTPTDDSTHPGDARCADNRTGNTSPATLCSSDRLPSHADSCRAGHGSGVTVIRACRIERMRCSRVSTIVRHSLGSPSAFQQHAKRQSVFARQSGATGVRNQSLGLRPRTTLLYSHLYRGPTGLKVNQVALKLVAQPPRALRSQPRPNAPIRQHLRSASISRSRRPPSWLDAYVTTTMIDDSD
jgi:hypothetical protein